MTTEEQVFIALNQFIAAGRFTEDNLFDLQTDVAKIVLRLDFPTLTFRSGNTLDETLWSAVEEYVGDVTDRIRRRQKEERTRKMAQIVVKRAHKILSRIKPRGS